MPKFTITETIHLEKVKTVRLGNTGAGNQYGYTEIGKAVKLVGDSRYALAAVGDAIEGIITSSEYATSGTSAKATVDGYSIGGIVSTGYKEVTFHGLQATPGTGVIAVGDYVLVGAVTAKDTALPGPLRVVKATDQAAAAGAHHKARVMSLGSIGTGAVGTVGVVELTD